MTADLVQRLRTSNFITERQVRAVAIELAGTGTDEAVKELIRMTEGRRKHWFKFYDLGEQVIGIEALGETRSQDALNYLRNIINNKKLGHTTEVETVETERYTLEYPYAKEVQCCPYQAVRVSFPNAKGELRKKLRYKYDGRTNGGATERNSQETNQYYQALVNSIKKLESSLASSPCK